MPKWSKKEQVKALRSFIELMLEREAPELTKEIRQALKQGQSMVQITRLLDDEEGWIHAWDQDKSGAVGEFVDHWLESLPVKIHTKLDLDDDCPICMAMQAAENLDRELTDEELLLAFKVAEKHQSK